eukprot:TRINITY_DN111033_c0_g1_i1.p1 TRINITY_DN111033_c0_g1~~TRINITY_DN111033_c0_g1_i1.p1  ORF type:complete len:860 (+),score=203.28 TRINITY_DN111033_c0_g1_i1:132-2711(+)
MQWLNGLMGAEQKFAVGTIVEYNSASSGKWIPAQVIAVLPDGSYNLDCKPNVPADRVRAATQHYAAPPTTGALSPPPGGAVSSTAPPPGMTMQFLAGSTVEYYSESQGGWIPAKVLGYSANGNYNLDCKPEVPVSKIRRPEGAGSSAVLAPPAAHTYAAVPTMDHMPGTGNFGSAHAAPQFQPDPRPPGGALAPPVMVATQDRLGSSAPTGVPTAASSKVPTPPVGLTSMSATQDAPAQLVRVIKQEAGSGGRWLFEANEEGLRALEAYGQRPVSVCTVCGPYRTGKSYLLNLLLGRIQQGATQFRVGSTTQACTDGIWMWGASRDAPASKDETALIFMDCEGFGSTEADRTRDAKIMSFCILLSSVFLLNTKGVLNESYFNALSLVCNLAEHIEEKGMQASRPALLWLLRDFVLELPKDASGRSLTPDEYLEQALHAKPTLAGVDQERSRAAREVREAVLRLFPRRHCGTLVVPIVDEEKLQRLADVPYSELRPEFRRDFEALRAQLYALARERPKAVGAAAVTGASLAAMVRHLVDAMNANKALNVCNAWEGVQHNSCSTLVEELAARTAAALGEVKAGSALPVVGRPLPVSDTQLAAALKAGRQAVYEEWKERAVGSEEVKADYLEDLQMKLSAQESELEQLNVSLAQQQLSKAGEAWKAWLSEDGEVSAGDPRAEELARLIEGGVPMQPCARAVSEALSASRMARMRWAGSVSSLQAELKLMSTDAASKVEAAEKFQTDDATLQSTREMGRLQGQVSALQTQAKEAIDREKILKDKVIEAEEAVRKEQKATVEVRQKNVELEQKVRELEAAANRQQVTAEGSAPAPQETVHVAKEEQVQVAGGPKKQPKCGCSIM